MHLFNDSANPKFNKLLGSYNRDGYGVVDNAGGNVTKQFARRNDPTDPTREQWENTCAARLSHSLNGAGYSLPHPNKLPANIRVLTSDKGNYIYGVRDMKRYLTRKYGNPTSVNMDLSNIQGKTGIIHFHDLHVDLWNKSYIYGNNGSPLLNPGTVATDYIGDSGSAVFWELQ